jgi:hypothetical protein
MTAADHSTLPANPLIQPHPADTLNRCALALAALEGIRPADTGADDPEGIGLAALLRCIGSAVQFEAERARTAPRAVESAGRAAA